MLILIAMWEAKSCDLPADDKHLAWVAKVSATIWRRKLAPIIMPMLSERNGRIFSEKLQENARKTEEYCYTQYRKKTGNKSDKPLKQKDTGSTGVQPGFNPGSTGVQPLPLTINSKEEEGVRASARGDGFSEGEQDPLVARVIAAVGIAEAEAPRFWIGDQATAHVTAWETQHGLTEAEIVAEAAKSRKKNLEPPDGPKGLDRWMEQAGAAKRAASGVKARAETATPDKAPTRPEDRMAFYADWIKDTSKPIYSSVVSHILRDALLRSGLVTEADFKARGIW